MKKKFILALIGISSFYFVKAQQLVPEVVSPAGGIDQTANISFEWTLGELATATSISENGMLTEGFHQPLISIEPTSTLAADETSLHFEIFPNPVESFLEVRVLDKDPSISVQFILTDLQGKHLLKQDLDPVLGMHKIDLSNFSSGGYILQCVQKDGTLLQSFKVIKAN